MNTDPRNKSEYDALIWAHCRECCGSKRTDFEDCKNKDCKLYTVKNRPRQITLNLSHDYNSIVDEIIQIGIEVSKKYGRFQIFNIRTRYVEKHGTGNGLNWGALVRNRKWLSTFKGIGEAPALNERSHSDKVKIWAIKKLDIQA